MGTTKVKRSSPRRDPLLPQTHKAAGASGKTDRCGACGRFILLLLPILACAFVLGSLFLLVYRLGVPITDTTISQCLSDYSPKVECLVVIFIGATLTFVVTVMRNIQINVYNQRQKCESKAMRFINLIAAVSNILGYAGFVLLATYDVDGPGQAHQIHYVGAFMYFILTGVYGILHIYLLCKQVQYPMFCKIIFTMVPVATIACSITFAVNPTVNYAFEWFSVALHAVFVGLMSVLFMVDSVDDELRDFFCCRVRKR